MKSAFEGWEPVDIEGYLDADYENDDEAKQRIAARYGMTKDEIIKVLTTPVKSTFRRRMMGRFWRLWYRIFPHPLER